MREVFEALEERARHDGARIVGSDDRAILGCAALAARVAEVAAALPERARTVAVAGRAGLSWVVADLAASLAGRRVVPIPGFFSAEQVSHLLGDANVDLVLVCDEPAPAALPASWPRLRVDAHATPRRLSPLPAYAGGAQRVIYTSGTTGTPKGVLHTDRQIGSAVRAIAEAVGVDERDVHLSALPPSLLLEQIAGVMVPLVTGARLHVSAHVVDSALAGRAQPLADALELVRPSATVLVPQLLSALVATLSARARRAPARLRFAAVGGAPVPLALVAQARAVGVPVLRGYGLSECASVVAVERPGEPASALEGACGRPLGGVRVDVEDGEIVVRGPTVMRGYVGREDLPEAVWRTGDSGSIDAHGTLIVRGRRDRTLVLPSGRNVAPEWVEAAALTDVRFAAARLRLAGDAALELDLRAAPPAREWVLAGGDRDVIARLRDLLGPLPDYARPARVRVVEDGAVMRTLEIGR